MIFQDVPPSEGTNAPSSQAPHRTTGPPIDHTGWRDGMKRPSRQPRSDLLELLAWLLASGLMALVILAVGR